jgi:hypothetical protein
MTATGLSDCAEDCANAGTADKIVAESHPTKQNRVLRRSDALATLPAGKVRQWHGHARSCLEIIVIHSIPKPGNGGDPAPAYCKRGAAGKGILSSGGAARRLTPQQH